MANFMIYKILPQLKKKIAWALRTDVGSIPAWVHSKAVWRMLEQHRGTHSSPFQASSQLPVPISSSLVLLYCTYHFKIPQNFLSHQMEAQTN